ncbi:MAG: PD-(D/E)XK nuclease family protein [Candidatus Dormibacteria bacterium]
MLAGGVHFSNWRSDLTDSVHRPRVPGPTRVTGGPRSGKTGLLARTAADWLEDGGQAGRLVVVTRSHSTLREMEARIAALLPDCHIPPLLLTQEELARRVLEEAGEPLGKSVGLSRLGEWMAMREALEHARPLLKRLSALADDPGCIEDLLEFAALVKQVLVGPGLLAGRLHFEGGLLAELALITAEYQDALRRMEARDTRDLTADAVALLERDGSLLDGWADLLLVDEAEDLSPSQGRLLSLLGRRLTEPCRMVLAGDRRVSLPSFRGPTASFFDEAYPREFHPGEWALGEAVASWVQTVAEDLGVGETEPSDPRSGPWLGAAAAAPPTSAVIWEAADEADEALAIAREIQRAHLTEKLAFEEVAILLWDPARQLGPVVAATSEVGVPTRIEQRRWADSAAVRVVLAWLGALADPDDEPRLIECLSLGPRGCDPSALWRLRQEAARDQIRLSTALVRRGSAADDDGPSTLPGLARLWSRLKGGVPGIAAQPMSGVQFAALVAEVEMGAGLASLALREPQTAAAMSQLARVTSDAAATRGGRAPVLRRFEDWVDLLRTGVRRAGTEQRGGGFQSEAGVAVMSVHHAKGKSWRRVFLPGMVDGVIPGSRSESGVLSLAETQRLVELVPELEDVMGDPGRRAEAERRLLLVALSRGWERVVLSWSRRGATQENQRSLFLQAIEEAGIAEFPAPQAFPVARTDLVVELAVASRQGPAAAETTESPALADEAARIAAWMAPWDPTRGDPVPASAELSATSLSGWLRCPRLHYYATLHLRRRDTVATVLGVAAHRLLETIHRNGEPQDQTLFRAMAMRVVHRVLMPEVRERLVDPLGSLYVELWLTRLVDRWAGVVVATGDMGQPLASEVPFHLDRPGYSLQGKVDALWRRRDGTLEIVDYKTSEAELPPVPEIRRQLFGDPAKGQGPSSWQLPIYVLAARGGAFDTVAGMGPIEAARNWYLGAEDDRQEGVPTRGFRLGQGGEKVSRRESLVTWDELDRIEAEITRQAALILEGRHPAAPRHDQYTCRGYLGCEMGFCCDGEGSVGSDFVIPVPQP